MNVSGLPLPAQEERKLWGASVAVALGAHVAVAALILAWARPMEAPVEEPVVLVELPADAAPAQSEAVAAQQPAEVAPQPEIVEQVRQTPPVEVPEVRAPLPKEAVILPPPAPIRPQPVSSAPAVPAVSAPSEPKADVGQGSGKVAGGDPKARKAEADYFALIAAHLNRKKSYPVEAKKARQQGVVTVRFTVGRDGSVSAATVKKSSGFAVLDEATVQLLYRVAPLPRMPSSMQRDSVTISLPIDYSLKTT